MAWKLINCYENRRVKNGDTHKFCLRFVDDMIRKKDKNGELTYSDKDWKAFLEKLTFINHRAARYWMETYLKAKYAVSV